MRATARNVTGDRLDQGELIRDDLVVMEQIVRNQTDYRDTQGIVIIYLRLNL